MKNTILAVAMGLCAAATGASAQQAYGGVVYDLAYPHQGDNGDATGIVGGLRFGDGATTFGGEMDLGVAGSVDYHALRLRGIVRNDMGQFAMFGGLGLSRYDLDTGGSNEGYNFGLGVDYEVTSGIDLRGEFIRDIMWGYTDSTNLRMGVMFGF